MAASEAQNVQRIESARMPQPLAVAGDVVFAEAMRHGGRHREMHEGDQRQRLGGGVIDGDLVGRAELLQHQDVGVAQQQVEAFDHQDRQRDRNQVLVSYAFGPGSTALELAVEHDRSGRSR